MRFKRPNQTEKEFHEITGDVKKVMQTTYKAHNRAGEIITGKIITDSEYEWLNFIITLNDNGIKIHEHNFCPDKKNEITFNEKGKETGKLEFNNRNELIQKSIHTYSAKDELTGYSMYLANGDLQFRGDYRYNDNKQMIENLFYRGKEGALYQRTVFTYNEQGKPVDIIRYDKDGNIEYKYHRIYDKLGNEVENYSESSDEKMKKYDQHVYQKHNEKGDIIFQQVIKGDGTEKIYTYNLQYDIDGKRIIERDDDKVEGRTEEKENDSRGNWIKKITFHNKVPLTIAMREYLYADEPERELIHPLAKAITEPEAKQKIEKETDKTEPLSETDAKWLAEWNNISPDNFPLLRYYLLHFKEVPSVINYTGPYIEAFALLKNLEENLNARKIHTFSTNWNGYERLQKYTLEFITHPGYLLQALSISQYSDDEFQIPDELDGLDYEYVNISQFQLLLPNENSGYHDVLFEEWLRDAIETCSIRKKPEKPKINMIEVRGTNFAVVEYPVHDNFIIKDLDVNYGHGFEKFHNELMQRFSSSKGLVLFHGIPGTGKTYYIRHMLRQMAAKRKSVIYIPPNMVDHLVEPAFMTFLSDQIKRWSHDGNFCVLLIEDAEPLLAKRQEGVRIQGVTNLLNMTDGLLNDMLNLQIICTFNVDLRKLDSALLRPGRLIARKEFKALSELDANLLAQRLGIKHHFKKPATLGEIYAMQKNHNTLIHDVEQDKGASSNIDDLI